ncbi:hypothetical protein GJAV_G00048910 [Gymnothorax javanicus]|nr:hypothetical protein GJAV_G00048910 [Gymnothorax javanicus]
MYLRIAVVLLVLCASVTVTEGSSFQCCVAVTHKIPRRILKRVDSIVMQKKAGACEIEAVVLHVDKKKYCASKELLPRLKPHMKSSWKKRITW